MGRDWHKLGGGGNGVKGVSGGGGGEREDFSNNSKRKGRSHESRNATSGCMASLFQFFDFHHFYLPSQHHHNHQHLTIDSLPKHPRGLVPPRNSLELTEESPLSTTYKDKEILNIPMGFKVKTEAGATRLKLRALALDSSSSPSEMVNSPGTKTPNLVARLMGLDLLPDTIDHNHSSPDLHVMSSHRTRSGITSHRLSLNNKNTGTRSLPESPRVSSARKSDFDIHRLSLQLNKESKYEELGYSRLKELKEEENWSPRDYARQILNQIKEKVTTRRIGMDITNTVKNREAEPGRKHHEFKRNSPISCSPRDRFPEKENKQSINHKTLSSSMSRLDQTPQHPKTLPMPSRPAGVQETRKRVKQQHLRYIKRCKEENGQTTATFRPKRRPLSSDIRNKQEDVFFATSRNSKPKHDNHLDKTRSKKCPVSTDLVNIAVKKVPSPPATKLPHKQVNASQSQGPEQNSKPVIRPGQTYKHEENLRPVTRNPNLDNTTAVPATSTTTGGTRINVEHEYVSRILSDAGITDTGSPFSSATWSSHPHPLDISIFRELEHLGKNLSGSLALRCNRRLLFEMVNEVLVGILNPLTKCRRNYNRSELVGKICSSIASYPRASFLNSEEIDALFSGNLPERDIVEEIERDIVDALVEETMDLYMKRTS